MIQLSFHGAAETVTGSKYLVTCNDQKILVDYGMFQGNKELRQRNWNPPRFAINEVQALVLTHAHLDHVGLLPRLANQGFAGPAYATPPSCDISAITLRDTAQIQEEDAEYRNKKKATSHEVALPLYTSDDAEDAIKKLIPIQFDTWTQIGRAFRFRYHIVGHLLGAAMVELEINDNGKKTTLLFSGDIGRYASPLIVEPTEPPPCDYLVCESTYGSTIHEPEDAYNSLAVLVDEIIANKSILLIPAFAVGRTQQIIFMLNTLVRQGRIPRIPIHVDSPMAISATDVYVKYANYHKLGDDHDSIKAELEGPDVNLHRKRESSKQLNDLTGPAVIISASGMMTGGRILHHLIQRLPDKRTVLAIVGYLPEGTIGRQLLQGARTVYIHKEPVQVNAKITQISALSGHADYYEILHWLEPMKNAPRKSFITHGELAQAQAMAGHLRESRGWTAMVPKMDETFSLD